MMQCDPFVWSWAAAVWLTFLQRPDVIFRSEYLIKDYSNISGFTCRDWRRIVIFVSNINFYFHSLLSMLMYLHLSKVSVYFTFCSLKDTEEQTRMMNSLFGHHISITKQYLPLSIFFSFKLCLILLQLYLCVLFSHTSWCLYIHYLCLCEALWCKTMLLACYINEKDNG